MSPSAETATLHFVPWMRAGAASAIGGRDPLAGALPAGATLSPWVRVSGRQLPATPLEARLHGPGHVQSLGGHTIVRVEPPPDTGEFEPSYFPFVELQPADLPWRYTPIGPGARSQLRPWLVLVVVRRQAGVEVKLEPGLALPVLTIDPQAGAAPSRELPDLADSTAWAHVQSSVPPADLGAALAADGGAAVARLVCPRNLSRRELWEACLVPAFEIGRRAGLGEAVAGATTTDPAWDLADPDLDTRVMRLPVYHHWSFATGDGGDFESLARRLATEGDAVLGRADLDVTNPGAPLPRLPAARPVIARLVGALKTPGVERGGVPPAHQAALDRALEPLLERSAQRPTVPAVEPDDYDPDRDDPIVAPPLYGSLQADRYDVPATTDGTRAWMRPLNLDPELRPLAGLGARVVRANQEALVASAWSQAGSIRETARALAGAHLSIEVGRSLARRVKTWDRGAVIQAARPLLAWIPSPASTAAAGSGETLASDLFQSRVPRGLVSSAFARATRARTALGRVWNRQPTAADLGRPARAATEAFLDATGAAAPVELKRVLGFAETRLAAGAWTRDPALDAGSASAPSGGRAIAAAPRARAASLDLSQAATAVVAGLDPQSRAQSGLLRRISALAGALAAGQVLPRRLSIAPVFTDPLCWDLARIDAELLLPGAQTLGNNRVALLSADNAFVAALLAGANHEMGRELLWREFPASPGATFFHRFWDTGPGGLDDIGDIRGWTARDLGKNVAGVTASALTVVLVRGDLMRRYPDAHVFVVPGVWEGNAVLPDASRPTEPVLQGALDTQSVFFGFPVAVPAMRGDRASSKHTDATAGWFVVIEERSDGPRFGLDAGRARPDLSKPGATWRDLSWRHLVDPGADLAGLPHAVARTPLPPPTPQTLGGLTWGHNAAHMAAITWQRPFRLYVHADRLLPDLSPASGQGNGPRPRR
jgi:hypothetical protein